jgi:hypothetical protein
VFTGRSGEVEGISEANQKGKLWKSLAAESFDSGSSPSAGRLDWRHILSPDREPDKEEGRKRKQESDTNLDNAQPREPKHSLLRETQGKAFPPA